MLRRKNIRSIIHLPQHPHQTIRQPIPQNTQIRPHHPNRINQINRRRNQNTIQKRIHPFPNNIQIFYPKKRKNPHNIINKNINPNRMSPKRNILIHPHRQITFRPQLRKILNQLKLNLNQKKYSKKIFKSNRNFFHQATLPKYMSTIFPIPKVKIKTTNIITKCSKTTCIGRAFCFIAK